MTYVGHLFDQSIPNFLEISETHQKSQKIFSDFEIIVFELFPLDTHFY